MYRRSSMSGKRRVHGATSCPAHAHIAEQGQQQPACAIMRPGATMPQFLCFPQAHPERALGAWLSVQLGSLAKAGVWMAQIVPLPTRTRNSP